MEGSGYENDKVVELRASDIRVSDKQVISDTRFNSRIQAKMEQVHEKMQNVTRKRTPEGTFLSDQNSFDALSDESDC
jgi:hypothetical protein